MIQLPRIGIMRVAFAALCLAIGIGIGGIMPGIGSGAGSIGSLGNHSTVDGTWPPTASKLQITHLAEGFSLLSRTSSQY